VQEVAALVTADKEFSAGCGAGALLQAAAANVALHNYVGNGAEH